MYNSEHAMYVSTCLGVNNLAENIQQTYICLILYMYSPQGSVDVTEKVNKSHPILLQNLINL